MRNYQIGAGMVLALSCVDPLLSLEIFRLSHKHSQSRAITVSSMLAKAQEENIQTLLAALKGEEDENNVAKRWLEVISKKSRRYRRERRVVYKLSEEEPAEVCTCG